MASLGTPIKAGNVVKGWTLEVVVTGMRVVKLRFRVAVFVLRIAAAIAGAIAGCKTFVDVETEHDDA